MFYEHTKCLGGLSKKEVEILSIGRWVYPIYFKIKQGNTVHLGL